MIAIVAATLFDGESRERQEQATVLIEDGRFVRVGGREVAVPRDADTIDGEGLFLLPGMIDLHAHVCWVPNDDWRVAAQDDPFWPNESEKTIFGVIHAERILRAGFTTVRDAFNFLDQTGILALRQAIRRGQVPGPRIYAAGYVGMTGTEVDMRMRPHVPRPYGYTADGPWEMRKRTREVARAGFDLVKMFTSGPRVPGEQESDVWYVNQTAEEVEAAVSEAHTLGMRVMVHATTEQAIRLAVEAGVDTIEHGWPLADDVIQSMLERGTILVPTISVYSERGFLREGVQQPLVERATNQLPIRADSVRRAYEAGVAIACGTDITPSMPTMRHGENAFELQALVRAGVAPIDAIRAATGVAAGALGVLDELGTVSEGKLADAVLVSRDPAADVAALEDSLAFVLKDGAVVVAP